MTSLRRLVPLTLALRVLLPSAVLAAGVEARFDVSSPAGGPFPSDRFTVPDPSNNTFLRVNLPTPAVCPPPPMPLTASTPTDCFDIDELNTLDGVNMHPRIPAPFTGPIDPSTGAGNVFFARLGNALGGHRRRH